MNKKILAAALAAAVFGPLSAYADPAGVTLYGKFDADFDVTGASDSKATPAANVPSRSYIRSSSSNFGIRGKEALSEGLNAIFQVESSIPINGSISPSGTAAAGSAPISGTVGTIGSRNTFVGLSGDFGTLFYGINDTPYKQSTQPLSITFADAMVWDYTTILSGNSTPTTANGFNRNSFDRRQENSVQYWSPNFSGVTFKAVYSADSSRPTSTGNPSNTNPALYGFSLVYDKDGFLASAAYERHIDYGVSAAALNNTATVTLKGCQLGASGALTALAPATTCTATAADVSPAVGGQSSDYAVKLGLGYTYSPTATSLGLIAERMSFNGSLGNTAFWTSTKVVSASSLGVSTGVFAQLAEARVDSYYLTLKQGVGEHGTVRASYGWDTGLKTNVGDLNSSRARAAVLGYSYNLSKRTDLYGMILQLNNDTNSKNDVGGSQTAIGSSSGATIRSVGAGIRHTF
jgi:predicted porin